MDAVKRRTIKTLVSKLTSVSEQTRTESICELRLLSKNDADSRPLIAEANAVPLIAESLYSPAAILQENAAAALLNLSISSKDHLMSSHGVLDALSHALRHPAAPSVAQCAAATIFSLLSVESFRPIIGHKRDIIFGLVEIVRGPGSAARSIKDALRALFGVALYPLNRAQMVELGAVQALLSLVVKDGRVGLVEDATAVIAQVAGCEESWEVFSKALGVEMLMDLLDNATGSSYRTKENAVAALLNLVQCGGEAVAGDVRERLEARVVDGIVDIVQNGSEKGKSKAVALLKVLDARDSRLEAFSGGHSS
ncbi:ARM repeat superfamily protein [Perilla frutescens var. hirtella]|uniref:ARM repeat superfamily protein n=1 Tax=Perilla frutescens var. hirtella TaxID=608512 RepID=A0AAD4J0N9_PERFH|nr:ARM repeat superfamily protein [Perilla frutescens var. hirtella]